MGSSIVTEDEVRHYIADNDTRAGVFGQLDYEFSPEQIAAAMRSAAREYNGIPPYVSRVSPDRLPADDNTFFDGIAYFLYMRAMQLEQLRDVPYEAGNVKVDIAARRIQHFATSLKFFGDRFNEGVKSEKKIRNYSIFRGAVG